MLILMKRLESHEVTREMMEKSLVVFTDGAARGNPGPGGWGAVLVNKEYDEVVELGGGKPHTTNNEMELSAIVAALAHASLSALPLIICTDSSYAIRGITEWITGWERKGWKTMTGEPVANRALWEQMNSLVQSSTGDITWVHIKGHAGIPGNERCDVIATGFADAKPAALMRGKLSNYPHDIFSLKVDPALATKSGSKKSDGPTDPGYPIYLSYIHKTLSRDTEWKKCELRVKGVSGAKWKKVKTAAEEAATIAGWQRAFK